MRDMLRQLVRPVIHSAWHTWLARQWWSFQCQHGRHNWRLFPLALAGRSDRLCHCSRCGAWRYRPARKERNMRDRFRRYLWLAGLGMLASLTVITVCALAASADIPDAAPLSPALPLIRSDPVRSNEVTTTISVFLPLVMQSSEPAWITGTYKGSYSFCQNAPGITATLQGLGGFVLTWDDHSGGASAGLGDPLGNTWDCRSVIVFAFSPEPPRGPVLSGTLDFSNAWTTVQNKNVLPQDVPVALRQSNWTSAPTGTDPRVLWFDVSSDFWTQRLPSFQDLCAHTTVPIPPGRLIVQGAEIGIMAYSSSIYRPELWAQDRGRFVDYGHYLTWSASCPGLKPTLRLLVQSEVAR